MVEVLDLGEVDEKTIKKYEKKGTKAAPALLSWLTVVLFLLLTSTRSSRTSRQ